MIKILIINTVRFKLNGISAVIKNYYQAMDRSGMVIDFLAIDTPCAEYQDFFRKNCCTCYILKKQFVQVLLWYYTIM